MPISPSQNLSGAIRRHLEGLGAIRTHPAPFRDRAASTKAEGYFYLKALSSSSRSSPGNIDVLVGIYMSIMQGRYHGTLILHLRGHPCRRAAMRYWTYIDAFRPKAATCTNNMGVYGRPSGVPWQKRKRPSTDAKGDHGGGTIDAPWPSTRDVNSCRQLALRGARDVNSSAVIARNSKK